MNLLALLVISSQTATVSFYGRAYDVGNHKMANGGTYKRNGLTCATYRFALGTKVQIEANGRRMIVTVTDRTARRFGHRLDLPDGCWEQFNYPRSKGIFRATVRKVNP